MDFKSTWFGTADDMVQISCPSTGLTRSLVAWRASGTYLSGGGFAKASGVNHQELSISWGGQSVDNLASVITQIQKNEMLYYLDPLTITTNAMPPYAAQYVPDNPYDSSPVNTGVGNNGYPVKAASYAAKTALVTIPVPAGQTLWVGGHGSGSLSVNGVDVVAVPTASYQRVTASFAGGTAYVISANVGAILNGVIAQVLPDGTVPSTGPFVPGLGFSALRLKDDPQITEYSAVLSNYQIALTANFIETGTWES